MSSYGEMREKFFSYLLKRPCTYKQAEEYLTRLKLDERAFSALMNEAEDTGLIDDEAYAKLFAEWHTNWGNAKISYELGARGVSRENIRTALAEIDDEADRAAEIAEGWLKSGIDWKKIKSRLMSRGFTERSLHSLTEM